MSRTRSLLLPLALAAALAAGLAGCGSGEEEPKGPTKAQFIAQADAICGPFNTKAEQLLGQVGRNAVATILGTGSTQAFIAPLDQAVREATAANRKFQALEPPVQEQGGAIAMQRSLGEQLTRLTELLGAAQTNDIASFQRVGGLLLSEQQRTARLQKSYGFRECGRSLTG
ncbi:MAG: hypothetical protein MUC84_11485 [Solirubrobacteraceae bacterium]|nr:hypothetical protein [Solirubrobacteraceae bacterium]